MSYISKISTYWSKYREFLPIALIAVMVSLLIIAIANHADTVAVVTCAIISVVSTAMYFMMTYFQRHPSLVNGYNRIKPENKPEADRIIDCYIFILKTISLAFFIEPMAVTAFGKNEINPWIMAALSGLMLVSSIKFGIRLNRLSR